MTDVLDIRTGKPPERMPSLERRRELLSVAAEMIMGKTRKFLLEHEKKVSEGQQWYLPEVINDTEGDAKVIPFPIKE